MDFDLTRDQLDFKASVESLAQKELAPGALQRAHSDEYPWEVARLLSEHGLMGMTLGTDLGGQGASLVDAVIAMQAIAASCPRSADVFQAGNFGPVRTFAEYANPALRERYLPDILAGRSLMSLGMTEPEAGSAATDLKTSAVRQGDNWIVNGTKVFSTHSPDANSFLVYVRYGPGIGGIGSLVIDRDAPGLTIGEPSEFMSGERWCQLYFEDCQVPDANLLLGEGGFKKQIAGFNIERIGNAARSLAVGRYAFEQAKEHAKIREQFGRALMDFQGLQWQFADMALALEGAQLLLFKAATATDSGIPSAYDTTLAKLAANTAGFAVANQALQVMGATGYSKESLVEYCVRRTRGWQIAGGSTEMLKNRIAETIFDTRFSQRAPKGTAL